VPIPFILAALASKPPILAIYPGPGQPTPPTQAREHKLQGPPRTAWDNEPGVGTRGAFSSDALDTLDTLDDALDSGPVDLQGSNYWTSPH
jgi:hypothetical protein